MAIESLTEAIREQVTEAIERNKAARLPSPARRKSLREEGGFTVRAAAAIVGVSPMSILTWEAGGEPRSLEHRLAYRHFLDAIQAAVE